MTDHPLVPVDIRAYLEKFEIESNLNKALNTVLIEMPQDPLSTMAVKLLESNVSAPTVAKLFASVTSLCDFA